MVNTLTAVPYRSRDYLVKNNNNDICSPTNSSIYSKYLQDSKPSVLIIVQIFVIAPITRIISENHTSYSYSEIYAASTIGANSKFNFLGGKA